VLTATEVGRASAVRLLVELGFDVHAGHRHTPLHQAAYDGNVKLVTLLLELGADPTRRDHSFNATALGWAEHNHQEATAALLRPLTPD
jgi:ankyrin repeat protein